MNHLPVVSVIIPLYNKADYIERTIHSVRAQSMREFEIIVVDDGSTDGGPAIVERSDDPRICLLRQGNAGVSAARNRGIEEARSSLIAFLDADDEWMPEFLATVLRLRRDYPHCDVFATSYVYRHDDSPDRAPVIRGLPAAYEGVLENYFEVASRSDPPLWTSAVTVTKKAIRDVGGFPVGVISGEDLLTWARLAVGCQIAYINQPHAAFCLGREGDSGSLRRLPDTQDCVGEMLEQTLAGSCVRAGSAYLALWYKMKASCFLRAGLRRRAAKAAFASLRHRMWNWRVCVYLVLVALPSIVSVRLMKWATR